MFKKFTSIICSVFFTVNIFAQSLVPNDAGSAIKFAIKNFGITVNGSFKGLKGNISFNPVNVFRCYIQFKC
jgi:polyisoprenoid-binding protein YceI